MPDFIDNTGQIISLTSNPSKIISLVPSLTELLCDLGIDEDVVGITKFCVHPKTWFSKKSIINSNHKTFPLKLNR